MSIALFFLLSGFFLAALLGVLERKRKVLGISAGCLAAIACIIVFLQPVQLPPTQVLLHGSSTTTTTAPTGPPGAGVDDGAATATGAGAGINDSPGPVSERRHDLHRSRSGCRPGLGYRGILRGGGPCWIDPTASLPLRRSTPSI